MSKLPINSSVTSSTHVYVGMSGGVDSSVAAALLLAEGYKVTGVYMKNWTQDLPGMLCPWADDLADAKRVAVQLGIPFKVFDFEAEYKQQVVDYMVREYQAGRTPNPDIMCNQDIKFDLFLRTALADGADMIATGHYARTSGGQLLTGLDQAKDQSYFLYRVTQSALQKTLLPIGKLIKPEVRAKAHQLGLSTAAKKDSQGICFVGKVGIKEFLQQYITAQPGSIINKKTGQIIGQHDGAVFYTIGQRHGLNVGGGLPYYVVSKDMPSNTVYVSTDLNDENLWRHDLMLGQLHWINHPPDASKEYHVRLRYRAPLIACTMQFEGDELKLHLTDPERAITAGQSAVLYDGDRVVGGGIVIA